MIKNFTANTKGLTKNPLGIIALFVSLIYGFACLVLSTSISNLHGVNERLPLIWFIIAFPLIILIAFIFLVVKHHEKLYSPSDYRADEAFIQTIGKDKIKERQLKEVKELEQAEIKENIVEEEHVKYGIDDSEKQIQTTGARTTKESEEQLLAIYKNSELWATKELSLKYNVLFKNNVSVSVQSRKIELDAYGLSDKGNFIAEIKYWESNKYDANLRLGIQIFLSQREYLESAFGKTKEFKLIVVFVFDNLKDVNKSNLFEFVKSIYNDAEVEFYDYAELRTKYE
jgi:hypothetical protein